jgi:hypothetical protein
MPLVWGFFFLIALLEFNVYLHYLMEKTNSGDNLMSNMLEQAIADAAALREQAIKNAEQSVLDKYSSQIKEAVDKMLDEEESPLDRANKIVQEAEAELEQPEDETFPSEEPAEIEAPPAYAGPPGMDDLQVKLEAMIEELDEDKEGNVTIDLGSFMEEPVDLGAGEEAPMDDGGFGGDLGGDDLGGDLEGDLGGDLDLGGGDLGGEDDLDLQLQEVLSMLQEEDIEEESNEQIELDENVIVDFDPFRPTGITGPMNPTSKHNMEMANALEYLMEDEEESESEDEELMGKVNNLQETVEFLTQHNDEMESVLHKMEGYLEETLLSNAKLLYQNRTLSDASLNERQKSKIVEAIANAESPKEAKRLHETLKATVGSTPNRNKGPQSLSESVNRKSNLSSMLNSRQNINESKQSADPFLEKMQKLAGIKK